MNSELAYPKANYQHRYYKQLQLLVIKVNFFAWRICTWHFRHAETKIDTIYMYIKIKAVHFNFELFFFRQDTVSLWSFPSISEMPFPYNPILIAFKIKGWYLLLKNMKKKGFCGSEFETPLMIESPLYHWYWHIFPVGGGCKNWKRGNFRVQYLFPAYSY